MWKQDVHFEGIFGNIGQKGFIYRIYYRRNKRNISVTSIKDDGARFQTKSLRFFLL
ncbi:hypothetical protein CI610_03258 [invertebrate metagenome]|uniref:Uncharacterized protein n=1 Tax=invertebrate metagenome TaxID=1711999 RepID=A0A2H9T3N1_9ZZZZ